MGTVIVDDTFVRELHDEIRALRAENAALRQRIRELEGTDDFPEARIESLDGPARVVVQLSGEDGNIFSILGRATRALKRAGQPELADQLTAEVTAAGSYDEALQAVMRLVDTR